jgi:hypothetical protein
MVTSCLVSLVSPWRSEGRARPSARPGHVPNESAAMRGCLPGLMRTPHPALRATFSPGGEGEKRPATLPTLHHPQHLVPGRPAPPGFASFSLSRLRRVGWGVSSA